MSHKISIVQETFSAIYNLDIKYFNSHQSFDYLFADHEAFTIGELQAYNIPTPGHTPACLSYVIGDAVFVGDTLFMPDFGVGTSVISRKAVQGNCLILCKHYMSCLKKRVCFYAMTIYQNHVNNMNMKHCSKLKKSRIFTFIQG